MKIKMFGKYSISSMLFWGVIILLGLILIYTIKFTPELINNENIPILINMMPLIRYLSLLIPLALVINTFRKEVIFTKKSIKYLKVFALINLLTTILNIAEAINLLDLELSNAVYLSSLNIILIVFSLFIAAIFEQGFQIQQDNDLTI
jgi:hypothetical protein